MSTTSHPTPKSRIIARHKRGIATALLLLIGSAASAFSAAQALARRPSFADEVLPTPNTALLLREAPQGVDLLVLNTITMRPEAMATIPDAALNRLFDLIGEQGGSTPDSPITSADDVQLGAPWAWNLEFSGKRVRLVQSPQHRVLDVLANDVVIRHELSDEGFRRLIFCLIEHVRVGGTGKAPR
jgi:hypothetical protein